jgi:hypothetical protein
MTEFNGREGKCDECGEQEMVFEFEDLSLCEDCLAAYAGVDIAVSFDGVARTVDDPEDPGEDSCILCPRDTAKDGAAAPEAGAV